MADHLLCQLAVRMGGIASIASIASTASAAQAERLGTHVTAAAR